MKNQILVVEDNIAVREEICDILSMEGYNVTEAKNGKIGLEEIRILRPKLVITDIVMPEMGGFELFRQIRKNPKTRDIPVIFLSAKAEKTAVEKAKCLNNDLYIIKPVSSEILINKIKLILIGNK
ncbi:MAG: response regulator [Bacteroidales bacterium]|nr:response regulator [Bacteroidales bacterium]